MASPSFFDARSAHIIPTTYGSVGPGRTFGSKLRKNCENGPLALLGQAV